MIVTLIAGLNKWGRQVTLPAGSIDWLMGIGNLRRYNVDVNVRIGYRDMWLSEIRINRGVRSSYRLFFTLEIDPQKELVVEAAASREMEVQLDVLSHREWLATHEPIGAKELNKRNILEQYCDTCGEIKPVFGRAFAIADITDESWGRLFHGKFTCNDCSTEGMPLNDRH